jgi:hypothetical protein
MAYYAQALQVQFGSIELCLDEGLGLAAAKIEGRQLGTEFDIDDLIWMDTATKSAAAKDGIVSGMSPDEVRFKYHGLGPVKGGASPMMQQQMFSLAALAERDQNKPFSKPAAPPPALSADTLSVDDRPPADQAAKFIAAVRRKAIERGLVHAA